jgi:hypothetical protein
MFDAGQTRVCPVLFCVRICMYAYGSDEVLSGAQTTLQSGNNEKCRVGRWVFSEVFLLFTDLVKGKNCDRNFRWKIWSQA